jgi:hypothetical protein
VVPGGRAADVARAAGDLPRPDDAIMRGWRFADLMRRVFAFDVLACPRCGGWLRLMALIEASAVSARILRHLQLPAGVPAARPSRAPPGDWAA